jgi:GNAT superfamily N-acetyltransferase
VSNWGLLAAYAGDERIGGAVLAFRTPGVDMLEGRDDLAVVWDLRVHPQWRRKGVGRALFQAAERWAQARGCRQLKIEPQNNNVGACRFYASQGFTLVAVNPFAYPTLPEETQLLWRKDLARI